MSAPTRSPTPQSVGTLLQYWRKARNLSQLALATQAEVSPRHLCFLETGRARPSREMVLLLAGVLDVPLREQNALLLAAGFAPRYTEASLDAPELAPVRGALDAILRQQEPFPAVVMNRRWDILRANDAAGDFFAWLLEGRRGPEPANVLRMMLQPDGVRAHVANWEQVAEALLRRVEREAVGGVHDDGMLALLEELLALPGIPARLGQPDLEAPLVPVIPVSFAKDGRRFDFFSAVTTLGTPQDITVQEVRIECFFPAGEATRRAAERTGGTYGWRAARQGLT
jgi:transcriptional regulator with XRE-family HTH domain